mgnify:CR=1 FL=1
MFGRFGIKQIRKRTKVDELLKSARKIDSISAQILLREAYEISYHIFDHERDMDHPWNLVMERHKENYNKYGTLYRTVYTYRLRDVHKRFGLNLEEFLELPREMVELILDICAKEDQEDSGAFKNVRAELDGEFKKASNSNL